MSTDKLIIIGAGPKAMALAAKSFVLAELGFAVPEIHIIERNTIGANWTGTAGYTNGRLPLGTSPEKDIGFPYASTIWGRSHNERVNERMLSFSWGHFLTASHRYAEWVDRGRPAPEHREWAEYLQWVYKRTADRVFCHGGEVMGLALDGERWIVHYQKGNGAVQFLEGTGLVMTGPGRVKTPSPLPNHDNLFTVESFWKSYGRVKESRGARLALVGTGETAGAIAMALADTDGLRIDIFSPQGMTYSRGESYRENRVYTDSANGRWMTLSSEDRRHFIKRTDRGVFSLYAQSVLDRARHIDVVPGRLSATTAVGDRLMVESEYNGEKETRPYDYVVLATGADQLSFLSSLMDEGTKRELIRRGKLKDFSEKEVERRLGPDLAIGGLTPKLHLPMLSGMAQGPGFANLSCLGGLSDRILESYVPGE